MGSSSGVKESIRHKHRYSDEQKQVAVEIILTTAAVWRLPAEPWLSLH
ncbi:transposase IS3 family [Escherichia coli]|nr:transposase IS3 family [Escherichia coli]